MGRLSLLALALLVSCVTTTVPPPPEPSLPEKPSPTTDEVSARFSPLVPAPFNVPWEFPSPLDLDSWPFGWVDVSVLDLPPRFWSEQRPRWREALKAPPGDPRRVLRLEQVFRSAAGHEALRAAWLLAADYTKAGLLDQTRSWYDRAAELSDAPAIALARSWDQAFRLKDAAGARALWKPGAWTGDDARKAALLRQRLYLGGLRLSTVGADDFIAASVLDRDDLWAATWNGNVVRWSLATGEMQSLLASDHVAPIKALIATNWFLYAFQDSALLRYSKVTGVWRSFPYPPGWTGLRVQGVVARGEETLWVAHLGQGLWRWDAGEWTLVDGGGGGPFLNALADDGAGGLLVGTKDRGLWSWKDGVWTSFDGPTNVSVVQAGEGRWFVGTWGEGTWLLQEGALKRWSSDPDFVTGAAWTDQGPVWGALDVGLVFGPDGARRVLGPRDGIPPGGVTTVVAREGRWYWGTMGQGWAWWSEYENSALLR